MADSNIQKKSKKPPLFLKQVRLLAKKVKKYPCLYKADKSYKPRDVIRNAWKSVSSPLQLVDDDMFKCYLFY